MIPEGCRVLAIFWAREDCRGGFRFRTPRVRDPAEGADASMSAPIASTVAGDVNGGATDASGPALVYPTTADGELAESQSHRKPELGGARGDDAGNSARDASSEPEDPVERFAVMRALETLRDDDAEPHERTSACERLRDFASATPVPRRTSSSRDPGTTRDVPPDPRAGVSPVPEDRGRRPTARRRRRSSRRAPGVHRGGVPATGDGRHSWRRRIRRVAKTVSAVDALAAKATRTCAPEDVAARVSALDVIGRCAGEVRGIFADFARAAKQPATRTSNDPTKDSTDDSKRDGRGRRPRGHVSAERLDARRGMGRGDGVRVPTRSPLFPYV